MVDHFFFFYHQLHQDSEYKENLHYAALRNHKTNRSRKKQIKPRVSVYTPV